MRAQYGEGLWLYLCTVTKVKAQPMESSHKGTIIDWYTSPRNIIIRWKRKVAAKENFQKNFNRHQAYCSKMFLISENGIRPHLQISRPWWYVLIKNLIMWWNQPLSRIKKMSHPCQRLAGDTWTPVHEPCYAKTGHKIFVTVIPKEGLSRKPYILFLQNAGKIP